MCHALARRGGGIRSEFTITKIADQKYYVVSAGAAERYDSDYLRKALPADGSVGLRNITTSRGCFVIAGPRSRDLLSKLTDTPLDNASFPWLTGQTIEVGLAADVHALRVNFVGSLGWELHFPIEYAHHLFDAVFDRFVRMNKGEFIGKAQLQKQLAAGVPNRFVTLEVHGVTDADPLGNEPLFDADGRIVGRATSGYYGHCVRKSLAIGYVKADFAAVGTQLSIEILGERRPATVIPESPYDPDNHELRA